MRIEDYAQIQEMVNKAYEIGFTHAMNTSLSLAPNVIRNYLKTPGILKQLETFSPPIVDLKRDTNNAPLK